ncbi:MAG: SUMF1/EgtB/PvdO family nonheme iron enzyme, partial [Actinomycetota bacterium]
MVLVPAGAFTMGADGAFEDERPAHRVELPAFYIDRHEVTVAEYARFVAAAGHPAPPDWPGGKPDPKRMSHPVVNVSWRDANAYARWAQKRLPTEAEWEKAARGEDGRTLPWGSAWDAARANVEGPKGNQPLKPVGSYPGGASPYGALDMTGNAWEWTADWYAPYPGNTRPSVHYGQKFRSVRGEGSINFYNSPPLHTQAVTTRARVQPFGRYDSLGFRCVRDAGQVRRIAPAAAAASALEKPMPPRVEAPAEVAARYPDGVPVRVTEGRGVARSGVATFGFPFPEGQLKDVGKIRTGGPVQARPLAKWRDGSIRWALLDVPATVKAKGTDALRVRWDGVGAVPDPKQKLTVREDPNGVTIETGVAKVQIRSGDTRWLSVSAKGGRMDGPEEQVWVAAGKIGEDGKISAQGSPRLLQMRAPTLVQVIDRGPLRARIRVEGSLEDPIKRAVIRYRCRVDATAGSPHVGLVHTFTYLGSDPLLAITDYALEFRTSPGAAVTQGQADPKQWKSAEFGGDRGTLHGVTQVEQISGSEYRTKRQDGTMGRGTRAPGWVSLGVDHAQLVAVKNFWQQYPKRLSQNERGVRLHLWTGDTPFDADNGIAKTHQLMLSAAATGTGRQQALAQLAEPLFGIAPADWYCATRSLGVLAPYSLSKYAQFETEIEAAADLMARNRPYGMRHWGDNYFGGPYKGINAYQNLEYDVAYNHLMQFARTGARKYLDYAVIQARHQGDIDMKHDQGPQWKHSPRHTTTEAELGHVFLRGLVASTWITGDPEGLENARILGDWLITVVARPSSQGNERQIGWGLYALTGIYEATWDRRYLQAMKANVDRLLAGQDNLGRFSIRWDNRISFFYGVTLSGFVKYYEVTGDERIADCIKRIVTRLHGFYPEYAGRTLEGLARSTTTYALLFLTVVTLLNSVGVPVATLLTGAGVAGLALSFGAQRVVRDVLTGAFILVEDQFRVGEVVTLVLTAGLPQ